MTRAWGAADSSKVSEISRGAERDRGIVKPQQQGPAKVAHRAGQGAAGRSSLGRSPAIPLGLKIAAGSAEHWQPTPAAGRHRGREARAAPTPGGYSWELQAKFSAQAAQEHGTPCTSPGPEGPGSEMEVSVPAPVLVLQAPAYAVRAPGLSGSFPPAIRQPGSPATRRRVLPAPA